MGGSIFGGSGGISSVFQWLTIMALISAVTGSTFLQ